MTHVSRAKHLQFSGRTLVLEFIETGCATLAVTRPLQGEYHGQT